MSAPDVICIGEAMIELHSSAINVRHTRGLPPLTFLFCETLPSNRKRLKNALVQFAFDVDHDLGHYVEGAMIVPDVAPYETAKLRLLNGPHSAIAYLGYLAGHQFVHEVMADAVLSGVSTSINEEIAPTVSEPSGIPLGAYTTDLSDRFRNSSVQYRKRLLGTIRDRIQMKVPFGWLATAVAAWIVPASGETPNGQPIEVRDRLAERMVKIGEDANGNTEATTSGFFGIDKVFCIDLPQIEAFKSEIIQGLRAILNVGARRAAGGIV